MTCVSASSRSRAKEVLARHYKSLAPSQTAPLQGLRIGLPNQTESSAPQIQIPKTLLAHLQSKGASLHPVSLPSMQMALPAYYVLASAEASSNLARYGGGWFGSSSEKGEDVDEESGEARRRRIRTSKFGTEVKKRLLAGTHALSAEYV
jgi:aspartyl-tRNA(Asn)/glutamyl-tRNA(Gln) amidotransferase subunit A